MGQNIIGRNFDGLSCMDKLNMRFCKFRNKMDLIAVGAALTLAVLPTIGLISGTAISLSKYGGGYSEVSLRADPQQYWFIIKIEIAIVAWILMLSIVRFPIVEYAQVKIELFREKNRVRFYLVAFLGVPVVVTALILLVSTLI